MAWPMEAYPRLLFFFVAAFLSCAYPFIGVHSHFTSLNILLVSAPFVGHSNSLLAVGEELAIKGHNVTYCSLDNWVNLKEKAKDKGMKYLSAGQHKISKDEWLNIIHRRSQINGFSSHNPWDIFEELKILALSRPLSGVDAIAEYLIAVNLKQWDIIVTEQYLLHRVPCIAKSKNVSVVAITDKYFSNESPSWPFPVYQSGLSDDLSFQDRMMTALTTIVWRLLSLLSLQWFVLGSPSTEALCKENFKYPVELGWEIPLIISSVIGFEFPRTMSPLTTYVGPVLSFRHMNSSLSVELSHWLMEKKSNSVIFISMGSQTTISKELANAIFDGTNELNYSVVWSLYDKDILSDKSIDKNKYYVSSWIPQTSFFQHKSLLLAILHGGSNGIHESLYFGIPSIVIPHTGDQFDWAARVENAKVGIQLKTYQITSSIIRNTITSIAIGNYHERAKFMRILMKKGGGTIKAANLVEFYGTYGYNHLIPAPVKYQWNWIQYYNVDVFTILLSSTLVLMYLCCCMCCNSRKKID